MKEWLAIIKQGRIIHQDPRRVIDGFTKDGPLKKLLGLVELGKERTRTTQHRTRRHRRRNKSTTKQTRGKKVNRKKTDTLDTNIIEGIEKQQRTASATQQAGKRKRIRYLFDRGRNNKKQKTTQS